MSSQLHIVSTFWEKQFIIWYVGTGKIVNHILHIFKNIWLKQHFHIFLLQNKIFGHF